MNIHAGYSSSPAIDLKKELEADGLCSSTIPSSQLPMNPISPRQTTPTKRELTSEAARASKKSKALQDEEQNAPETEMPAWLQQGMKEHILHKTSQRKLREEKAALVAQVENLEKERKTDAEELKRLKGLEEKIDKLEKAHAVEVQAKERANQTLSTKLDAALKEKDWAEQDLERHKETSAEMEEELRKGLGKAKHQIDVEKAVAKEIQDEVAVLLAAIQRIDRALDSRRGLDDALQKSTDAQVFLRKRRTPSILKGLEHKGENLLGKGLQATPRGLGRHTTK